MACRTKSSAASLKKALKGAKSGVVFTTTACSPRIALYLVEKQGKPQKGSQQRLLDLRGFERETPPCSQAEQDLYRRDGPRMGARPARSPSPPGGAQGQSEEVRASTAACEERWLCHLPFSEQFNFLITRSRLSRRLCKPCLLSAGDKRGEVQSARASPGRGLWPAGSACPLPAARETGSARLHLATAAPTSLCSSTYFNTDFIFDQHERDSGCCLPSGGGISALSRSGERKRRLFRTCRRLSVCESPGSEQGPRVSCFSVFVLLGLNNS